MVIGQTPKMNVEHMCVLGIRKATKPILKRFQCCDRAAAVFANAVADSRKDEGLSFYPDSATSDVFH